MSVAPGYGTGPIKVPSTTCPLGHVRKPFTFSRSTLQATFSTIPLERCSVRLDKFKSYVAQNMPTKVYGTV